MKIYEVGGCVRDRILGLEPKDIDYVVVGSNEKQMLALGYQLVGKDFPVFLHPETGDEYALARKEKKIGVGYGGFSTETQGVTLEEDLFRRDLTMNAIAMDNQGNFFDPFNGKEDIKNGILRHVSEHFAEDPVRILRIARFSARYNFSIADSTYELMTKMVQNGEFDHLTGERVWKEFDKALHEPHFSNFLSALEKIQALGKIFSFNEFFDKKFFLQSRSYEEKLCYLFSQCQEKELKKWKMPEEQLQLILDYKKWCQYSNFYKELNVEEKLQFIASTKSLHEESYALKVLQLILNHQQYREKEVFESREKQALLTDIYSLKKIDYESLIAQLPDKKGINHYIKNIKLETLANNCIDKKTKLKIS